MFTLQIKNVESQTNFQTTNEVLYKEQVGMVKEEYKRWASEAIAKENPKNHHVVFKQGNETTEVIFTDDYVSIYNNGVKLCTLPTVLVSIHGWAALHNEIEKNKPKETGRYTITVVLKNGKAIRAMMDKAIYNKAKKENNLQGLFPNADTLIVGEEHNGDAYTRIETVTF